MFKNRLFHVLIAMLLVLTFALTAQEALATARLKFEGNAAIACDGLPSPSSLHTKYVKEANMWIVHTEDGPTGVDGGLIELVSTYRTCSK